MNDLTDQQREFLNRYGFDEPLFRGWQQAVAEKRLSKAGNAVTGELLAPPPGTIQKLPSSTSKGYEKLVAIGKEAIRKGQVGVVTLNGGMATRFGGVVKGVVPVLSKARSFLALVIEDVLGMEKRCGGRIPVYLMNSFATDAATKEHFDRNDHFGADRAQIEHFTQFVSVRMEKNGQVFQTASGDISPYGPGHGDFAPALRASGALGRFLAQGGRYLLVRNVDNLGARLDPAIIGHHIQAGVEATVEVAPKWPEDVGGSPYLYEGQVQLVEQVRYPEGFDPNIVDVFNCNTFTFSAAALDRDFDLGWYYVEKTVDGKKAVQVEHLIGELTRFLKSSYLQVKRQGRESRFLPVKAPEDLDAAREEIREMYDTGDEA